MPQASEELRAKFEDDYAARLVLEGAGWTCDAGWWSMPTHEPSEGEWEAITYLIHEWDHAIGKRPPTILRLAAEVECLRTIVKTRDDMIMELENDIDALEEENTLPD